MAKYRVCSIEEGIFTTVHGKRVNIYKTHCEADTLPDAADGLALLPKGPVYVIVESET